MNEPKKKVYPSYPTLQIAGKIVESTNNDVQVRKILWNAPKVLAYFLKQAKLGDNITAKFVVKRPKRTLDQNNFFHLYLSLICESTGHTMEELKVWYKDEFLSKGITEVFGRTIRIVKSSADLNISEMCELMNQIEEQTNIPIPNPDLFNVPLTLDEYGKLKMKQKQDYKNLINKE